MSTTVVTAYNPNAANPQEHADNCRFQLENVTGWLTAHQSGYASALEAAEAKAECLLSSTLALIASLNTAIARAKSEGAPATEKEAA